VEETKRCPRCGEDKPTSDYRKDISIKNGLRRYCRVCEKELAHAYYQAHPLVGSPTIIEKFCSRCHIIKPAGEFAKHAKSKDGLNSWCLSCKRESGAFLAARRRDVGFIAAEKLCLSCGITKLSSEFYRHSRDKSGLGDMCKKCKSAKVKLQKYGITAQDSNAILIIQDGVCAICGTYPDRGLFVDHDHSTGVVRGLLCRACNTGIGSFRDDCSILQSAIAYLTQYSEEVAA